MAAAGSNSADASARPVKTGEVARDMRCMEKASPRSELAAMGIHRGPESFLIRNGVRRLRRAAANGADERLRRWSDRTGDTDMRTLPAFSLVAITLGALAMGGCVGTGEPQGGPTFALVNSAGQSIGSV